jgi:hypothetical protein
MLDNKTIKKIEEFVLIRPRSIQEISILLNKNWRTIDRYVEEIKKSYGTIDVRTFREGTRGALKIVYYSAIENFSGTIFQKELEKQIFYGRTKYDFSPFDIFQFVSESKKLIWMKKGIDESNAGRLIEFKKLLDCAKKQILFFSGNLSFINFDDGKINLFDEIEGLVKRGVFLKVLCRIDVVSLKNVEKLLSLNKKYGRDFIEIRHRTQPLRATIIDELVVNLKEVIEPTQRKNETLKRLFLFYTIREKDWIKWLDSIFWRMFNSSVGSDKRLVELKRVDLTSFY